MMPLIDTHSVIKEFIAAGINEQQAELITKTINQSNNNLVTKADLKASVVELRSEIAHVRSEINEVKSELKAEINEVKSELKAEISELGARIDKIDNNQSWLKAMGFIIIGLLVKLAFFS
jgi:predicted nuclease with TOPRIM domain